VENFMKMNWFKQLGMFGMVSSMFLTVPSSGLGQDVNVNTVGAPAAQAGTAVEPAPHLAYGVEQILQLEQAKVSDDTIVAFIKNSGNSYGLTADQIIYLQRQGVSSVVLNAMLNQPRPAVLANTPVAMAPDTTQQPAAYADIPAPTTPAPAVTYVQTPPATVYYDSSYYPYYYGYPGYYYYPSVSIGWGWGWGGGWRGGYYGGGFHRGGYSGGGSHGGGHGGGGHR
jgi:hypothetical protein